MDLVAIADSEARFAAYVEQLVGVIGHADRALPLRDDCLGLVMPGRRKSVEPMAAITRRPGRVRCDGVNFATRLVTLAEGGRNC